MGKDLSQDCRSSEASLASGGQEAKKSEELQNRLKFEKLLIALSTGFTNLPPDGLDEGIHTALQCIGEFTGVDRCFTYAYDATQGEMSLTHEWVREGIPSVKDRMQRVPTSHFQHEMEVLLAEGAFYVEDVAAMTPENGALQALYQSLDVESGVNVAMLRGGELIGLMGFVSVRRAKIWSEEDISLAKVLAEVLVSTLDRHRVERSLRVSEARYRGIVEDQVDLIVRWRPDGIRTFVNDAVCRLMGQSIEELVGRSIFDGIHPQDQAKVRRKIAALTPSKAFAMDEHRILRPDGSAVWMEWIDRGLFDKEGCAIEYQSIGRDISELRATQEKLEQRLEFERMILSISMRFINLPIESIDEAMVEALQSVCHYTGAERGFLFMANEDYSSAQMRYSWSAPTAPPITPEARQTSFSDNPWVMERMTRGEPIHIPRLPEMPPAASGFREELEASGVKSFINVPVRVGERLIGYLGFSNYDRERSWSDEAIALLRVVGEVFVNAMMRKETDDALRESEERLRITLERLEEGVFDWNIETGHAVISDHLKRAIGVDPRQNGWYFDEWESTLHPEDRAGVLENLNAHLAGDAPLYDAEYRSRTFTGEYRWMRSRGRVVNFSPEGKPLRMVGIQRDVTDRVEEREKLREMEAQLTHLGRLSAMGETVAGIAHEVNQPLHAAATFCAAGKRVLQSRRPDALRKGVELYQKVADQVNRAGDIIRRVREFTRPQPAKFAQVDLNAIVYEAVSLHAQVNPRSAVRVAFNIDPTAPQVTGDAVQLQQVVVNLLQNAYDALEGASHPHPTITVTTRFEDRVVKVCVADNAAASPLENPDKMFEAFYTTKPHGMGIGLSLCRTILQTHRGTIQAEKNSQGGMTFVVELPVDWSPPDSDPPRVSDANGREPPAATRRRPQEPKR